MSHNSKIILRYSQYKSILDTYISLPEFQEKATETMRSKRVTITLLCNYLGDSGVTSFTECRPQNVTGFLDSISGVSSSTKSGKLFILRHFFNYLYDENYIFFSGNELFPVIVSNKRDRILSFYSETEIKKLISAIILPMVKEIYLLYYSQPNSEYVQVISAGSRFLMFTGNAILSNSFNSKQVFLINFLYWKILSLP